MMTKSGKALQCTVNAPDQLSTQQFFVLLESRVQKKGDPSSVGPPNDFYPTFIISHVSILYSFFFSVDCAGGGGGRGEGTL